MIPYYEDEMAVIYNADCTDVLRNVALKPDCVITSPPYNCGKDYGEYSDSRPLNEYWTWLEDVLSLCACTLLPHGYLCVNHANYIGSRDSRVNVEDELQPILSRLLPFVDKVIWDKGPARGAAWGNFRTSPRLRAQHEWIFIHGGCAPMPPSDIEWAEWSRFTTSIWRIPAAGIENNLHPAVMPVGVAHRLVLLYSPAGGTIFDPFMGSGTSAVAAIRHNRKFVGADISKKYCEIAVERIKAEQSQMSLFQRTA